MTTRSPLVLLALAWTVTPAAGQDVLDLVRVDPANRSGEIEVSRAIVRMIGERSDSAAVRARASSGAPWGRLAVGPDEVLAEIGALAALGSPRAVPSVVQSPPAIAEPPAPPPAGATGRPTRAQPQPAAAAAGEEKPQRYFGIFVKPEPTERGGGGGGGSGGGAGGGGGGGGGGGW